MTEGANKNAQGVSLGRSVRSETYWSLMLPFSETAVIFQVQKARV